MRVGGSQAPLTCTCWEGHRAENTAFFLSFLWRGVRSEEWGESEFSFYIIHIVLFKNFTRLCEFISYMI